MFFTDGLRHALCFVLSLVPPSILYNLRQLALAGLLTLSPLALATRTGGLADGLMSLRSLDLPHPYCEGKIELGVAKEYFVEISNELPGVNAYNEMIVLYRRREWDRLEKKFSAFRETFDSSPLMEAVSFLIAQAHFDRLESEADPARAQEAEKGMREVLLVYPNSTLAPALTASAASYFLRHREFGRSLALYETAKIRYPLDPLSCVFQMGIGESDFQLRDWKAARTAFGVLLQKCQNGRLKTAAEMRLADAQWLLGDRGADKAYEKVITDSGSFIDRYFPFALYNIGELRYREHDYARARFYFTEFLANEQKDGACVPHALKRIADIAFHTDEPWRKVAGMYLVVRERAPLTDVGRFSYIHALLLGLRTLPKVEYGRRMKIIDEQIDSIKDEAFRELAYLEKGLAMLDSGERAAMDYLVRLNERSAFNLQKGPIGTFVRQRLLEILQDEVEKAVNADPHRTASDDAIFGPLEAAFPIWMKGTPYEDSARRFYFRMCLRRFIESIGEQKLDTAMETLDRWVKSPAWDAKSLSNEARNQIGGALLRSLFTAEEEDQGKIALLYLKHEASIKPFTERQYGLLWAAVSIATGDKERVKELSSPSRGLASPDPSLPKDVQPYLGLAWGESLVELGRYADAEKVLAKIKEPDLLDQALTARFSLHMKAKNYSRAYEMARQIFSRASEDEKESALQRLQDVTMAGKLWVDAPQVLGYSQRIGLRGKDLAPFYYLSGRAYFELARCKLAVSSFESGLKLDPTWRESAEARYRLGKCLLKENRKAQARKVWEELISQKDSFWSPLAQNELRVLK